MPKLKVNRDAAEFAKRLIDLLDGAHIKRHGAGAFLAKKYSVSTVVANAWLNGEYKPGVPIAEKIAADFNSTLDELYFGRNKQSRISDVAMPYRVDVWPFKNVDKQKFMDLTDGEKLQVEGVIMDKLAELEIHRKPTLKSRGNKRANG